MPNLRIVADFWCGTACLLHAQELGQIAKGAPEGITAGPINGDNMLAWEASIKGDVSHLHTLPTGVLWAGLETPRAMTASSLTCLLRVRRMAPRGRAAPSS